MTLEHIRAIVAEIAFHDWTFYVGQKSDALYLQVQFTAPDATAGGASIRQHGRKWLLSEHMTQSEVVLTAFKAALTAVEHEAREAFTYRGRAILGPHFDVEALIELADAQRVDVREVVA